MNVNPVSQQPHFVKEILYSDQTSRVAVLAVGILSSAAILAIAQPPGSLVLASIILATTLAISLNEEDKETQSVIYVAKESSPTPVFFARERPRSFHSAPERPSRGSSTPQSGERIPVGTEARNPRPQSFDHVPERSSRVVPPPRSDERIPVGTEARNPFPQSTENGYDPLSPIREPVGKRQREEMHGRGNAVRL